MIAAYQGFYEAEDIREDRNREFFRRFLSPSDEGMLIGAWRGERLVGYACLYWHFSSTKAVETVLMNDLYVERAGARRGGRPGADRGLRRGRPRARRADPRVVDRPRQRDRPAPLRLDRRREVDLDRVRAGC